MFFTVYHIVFLLVVWTSRGWILEPTDEVLFGVVIEAPRLNSNNISISNVPNVGCIKSPCWYAFLIVETIDGHAGENRHFLLTLEREVNDFIHFS
jgi:hypothetical protein